MLLIAPHLPFSAFESNILHSNKFMSDWDGQVDLSERYGKANNILRGFPAVSIVSVVGPNFAQARCLQLWGPRSSNVHRRGLKTRTFPGQW